MKKIILPIAAIVISLSTIAQEKTYSTKSGVIKFFSNAPLEKIEAVNSQVICKLSNKTGQMGFAMLIKGFKFDNSLMQDHFNENYMESSKPKLDKADFKGTITNIAAVNFAKDGSYPVVVDGNLTIHGVTKKVSEKGTIEVSAAKVSIKSIFKLNIEEYGIKGKYIGEKIAKEVEITIACKLD